MKLTYLDQGFVELLRHQGSDRTIAEAAWVSSDRAQNRTDAEVHRLLNYLARHGHWTPFGQSFLQLTFRIPIFVARQLMRSNVGIVWNEESRRYVDSPPAFHVPLQWRARSASMKQGSAGPFEGIIRVENSLTHETWDGSPHDAIAAAYQKCLDCYTAMIEAGIAPEQARIVLPVGVYTTLTGSFNLASLSRVYLLRAHPHAQAEIRELADLIDKLVLTTPFTAAWRALLDASSPPAA